MRTLAVSKTSITPLKFEPSRRAEHCELHPCVVDEELHVRRPLGAAELDGHRGARLPTRRKTVPDFRCDLGGRWGGEDAQRENRNKCGAACHCLVPFVPWAE